MDQEMIEEMFGERFTLIDMDEIVGNDVLCDLCSSEFGPDDKSPGGFTFSSYTVCPKCADEFMVGVIEEGEEWGVLAMQPKHATFYDFVHDLRAYKTCPTWMLRPA